VDVVVRLRDQIPDPAPPDSEYAFITPDDRYYGWLSEMDAVEAIDAMRDAANEIERLRVNVAMLRHAATIEAAAIVEQAERADRLQALIDSWAVAHEAWMVRCATNSLYPELPADSVGLPTLMKAERVLLAAATPKDGRHARHGSGPVPRPVPTIEFFHVEPGEDR
jgi:hypothetical protein